MNYKMNISMFAIFAMLPISMFSQTNYNTAIEEIVNELKVQIEKSNAKKVVFIGIQNNDGSNSELGQLITDEILLDCAIELPEINFMDRNDIDQFDQLEEIKSQKLISKKTVNAIANNTKADIVVTGVMTPFGEYYRLITKMYGSSSHNLIGGTKSTIIIEKHLKDLFETNKNMQLPKSTANDDNSTIKESNSTTVTPETGDICFDPGSSGPHRVTMTHNETGNVIKLEITRYKESCRLAIPIGVYNCQVETHVGSLSGKWAKSSLDVRISHNQKTIEYLR